MLTRTGGTMTHEYTALSTDTKPTLAGTGSHIPNGSSLLEMNTGDLYLYDQENDTWRKL